MRSYAVDVTYSVILFRQTELEKGLNLMLENYTKNYRNISMFIYIGQF